MTGEFRCSKSLPRFIRSSMLVLGEILARYLQHQIPNHHRGNFETSRSSRGSRDCPQPHGPMPCRMGRPMPHIMRTNPTGTFTASPQLRSMPPTRRAHRGIVTVPILPVAGIEEDKQVEGAPGVTAAAETASSRGRTDFDERRTIHGKEGTNQPTYKYKTLQTDGRRCLSERTIAGM
mmetsp:Transcript_8794/g.25318  ORF Transcript_8794/g.25318 Transcript_8794/m.25318 type:complete len:177 (-) Transcript_8794:1858-2388(-)